MKPSGNTCKNCKSLFVLGLEKIASGMVSVGDAKLVRKCKVKLILLAI
jgi:hypothetical protein